MLRQSFKKKDLDCTEDALKYKKEGMIFREEDAKMHVVLEAAFLPTARQRT